MSKTLFLIRHAKSSWADLSLADHDRPLGDRGKRDLPIMARHMADKYVIPPLILSSTAKRAKKTAQGFAKGNPYGQSMISYHTELYLCSPEQALTIVQRYGDGAAVGLTGHNPGWTEFVNRIDGVQLDNMPTCAVAVIRCSVSEWKDLSWSQMELIDFIFPKKLKAC